MPNLGQPLSRDINDHSSSNNNRTSTTLLHHISIKQAFLGLSGYSYRFV